MKFKLLLILTLLCSSLVMIQAEENDLPYLYYYSRMLGGIIIERADGSDSRLIGEDVIPANMSGIGGPGWSPSGKYFAAYSWHYGAYNNSSLAPYIIDTSGKPAVDWLDSALSRTIDMEWEPLGEDILLIIGGDHPIRNGFMWLIDVASGELLADFGITDMHSWRNITWDTKNRQIHFYLAPENPYYGEYYYVTMKFDGTTMRQPISHEEYPEIPYDIAYYEAVSYESELMTHGYNTSPSGIYETAFGVLTDTRTGFEVELPTHTQSTICRDHIWTDNEQYFITLQGTLRAGGGCGQAVLGISHVQGQFWRELGYCSWDYPPCVGWLPDQVNLDDLPAGSSQSVQLEPAYIEYATTMEWIDLYEITTQIQCGEGATAQITDTETGEIQYLLSDTKCRYADESYVISTNPRIIVTAYNDAYDLLATYVGYSVGKVTIWQQVDDLYQPVMYLNTDGYQLEFTADGQYLRARNVHGWKVFSIEDILNRIQN